MQKSPLDPDVADAAPDFDAVDRGQLDLLASECEGLCDL